MSFIHFLDELGELLDELPGPLVDDFSLPFLNPDLS
jgi:hypothetical protein